MEALGGWFSSQAPAVIAVFMLAEMRFALVTFKTATNKRLDRLERFRRFQLRREHQRAPSQKLAGA